MIVKRSKHSVDYLPLSPLGNLPEQTEASGQIWPRQLSSPVSVQESVERAVLLQKEEIRDFTLGLACPLFVARVSPCYS
jgi:hypothetical protein